MPLTDPPEIRPTVGDSSWFVRDRFGIFIHWGLYSLGARQEWLQHNEHIPEHEYEARYLPRFDPDLFDPKLWAETAANAGAKYVVATAKHHEGFCLWDSALTDFNAAKSPAARDVLREMLDAFRERNLRTGIYYSLIDWHHPHFVFDRHTGPYRRPAKLGKANEGREQDKYIRYLHGQVRELLTAYGPIDQLWFDFSYPKEDGTGKGKDDWGSRELVAMVREIAPRILINDRLDLIDEPDGWDFRTLEQAQPRGPVFANGQAIVWEAAHTFSGSWGYHRDEASWKSVEQLVALLIDTVSKGGNLLLNVGPTGRGEFDARAMDRLNGIGRWMKRHSRSIYGCGLPPTELRPPPDCRLTYNRETRRLYVHALAWPATGELVVEGLPTETVEYAQLLSDASEVRTIDRSNGNGVPLTGIKLPVMKPEDVVPVVEVFLKRD
jgi:alpha-L-fucosidase